MLINNQKYSCEACIRGHRVTTCKHHDRPLTKINRKGRPFSTCSICHRTPCAVPDEHVRIRREREGESRHHYKKPNGRYARPFQGFLPIAPRPAMKSGLSIAMQTQTQTQLAPAERSPEERSPNYQVEFTPREKYDVVHPTSTTNTMTTATTERIDIPSASVPDLSESLPSTSSIASSASSSSSSSSDLMPMPPLDFPLDLELELPLPILESNWDLDTGMGKNTENGLGMWPLDQTGFCGLDDMSAFPGQNTQFWVGEL